MEKASRVDADKRSFVPGSGSGEKLSGLGREIAEAGIVFLRGLAGEFFQCAALGAVQMYGHLDDHPDMLVPAPGPTQRRHAFAAQAEDGPALGPRRDTYFGSSGDGG